ncbi:hypothetical protein TSH100_15105 [Azospirillum sp. TSH100]|uniref:helix-turn-helix domain-containing protein n=1 Tax=Azospirillum sp. TSH100 TaxID=652764 RepID=UPI000D608765|nr:helix-turn-helix transcriptional regulator [Azospirillum sp. TSH100]PWC85484.1 hypothetical protein TSH100_15105 [Azospirillum sp. TSH100]
MSDYDPSYQVAHNGILQSVFRARLDHIRRRRKLTLAEFGNELGLSGAFIGNLINGKKAIRTKHIAGIVRKLEELEAADVGNSPPHAAPSARIFLDEASLEDLARRANSLGFNVSFTQIS